MRLTPFPRAALAAGAALLALGAAACGTGAGSGGAGGDAGGGDGTLAVVAAFYPLQFVAEQVGGDAVTVTNLVKPGAEPHDLELNPRQVAQVADARLVVYLKGFQPDLDAAVEQEAADRAFDVTTISPLLDERSGANHEGTHEEPEAGESHGPEESRDPHIWLDPARLATVADRLADRLAEVDPARATYFRDRAAGLRQPLGQLDAEYADGLATCQRREIVTSHAAFGYLADRYRLRQVAITGLSPEEEPSPGRLAEVAEQARQLKTTTIFFETLVSPEVSETLAKEVGARTAVLDPIEGLQPGSGGDYLSVMRANLATLRTALGCT
jgi:zinc transport system substrate-binding protein